LLVEQARFGSRNRPEKGSWTLTLPGWDRSVIQAYLERKLLPASYRQAQFLLTHCRVTRVSAAWEPVEGWQDAVTVMHQKDIRGAMKQL